MNVKKTAYWILMALPLVLTLAALRIFPEEFVSEYLEENGWAGQYGILLFPILAIIFGTVLLLMARSLKKQEKKGREDYNICIMSGLLFLGLFNVVTCGLLYAKLAEMEAPNEIVLDPASLIFGLLGLGMIGLGSTLPKKRRKARLALRTVWSLSSREVWRKCQRFAGKATMISGAVVLAVSLLTEGWVCTLVCLGIVAVMVATEVIYSYIAAKAK